MGTMLRCLFLLVVLAAAIAGGLALVHGPQHAPPSHDKPRIVSLAPNVTEILFALGLGENIVGVTDLCDYPPEAKSIKRVSGFGTPNIETLLAVSPDIVIACGLEKPEVLAALQRLRRPRGGRAAQWFDSRLSRVVRRYPRDRRGDGPHCRGRGAGRAHGDQAASRRGARSCD